MRNKFFNKHWIYKEGCVAKLVKKGSKAPNPKEIYDSLEGEKYVSRCLYCEKRCMLEVW